MCIHHNMLLENSEMDEEGGEGRGTTSVLLVARGRVVT
jgi:condensin-2 complex subunit D3